MSNNDINKIFYISVNVYLMKMKDNMQEFL
jgi:hypothetical protein